MSQVLFRALGNSINKTDRKAFPQGDYIQLPDHESPESPVRNSLYNLGKNSEHQS